MAHFGYYEVDLFDCPPFQMFSNGDDPFSVYVLEYRRFEPQSMSLWCKFVRRASSILDIGANVGAYSMAAASLRKDIPIHAFEPNPYAAARLRVNKHRNKFDNIQEHAVALADIDAISQLTWTVKSGGLINSGGTIGTDHEGKALAYLRRLDSLPIAYGPLPLVKMDVEGYEAVVLKGMSKLREHRPIIILESFSQKNCDAFSDAFPDYHFFSISEDGYLEPRERLVAAVRDSGSLNHLLLPSLNLL